MTEVVKCWSIAHEWIIELFLIKEFDSSQEEGLPVAFSPSSGWNQPDTDRVQSSQNCGLIFHKRRLLHNLK